MTVLKKTPFVSGKHINFREVKPEDAEFILKLRLDPNKNKYLNPVSPDVDKQRNWINSYLQQSDGHCYFIIENKNNESFGTVRLYDVQEDSFCWGSWILIDGVPKTTAIESALLVYYYAFDVLGFRKSHFDVRQLNTKVIDFHLRCGAQIIGEDEQDKFFSFSYSAWQLLKEKFADYLP